MDRGRRVAGVVSVVLALVTLLSASAGATVVSLGTDARSYTPPQLVVDSIGVGYTSWADGGAGQSLRTCRLAPHASGCEARHTFSFPGVATSADSGNAPVFTAAGQLAVLDSRCCVMSNQKVLLTSADHGTTFTGPTAIVSDHATGMTGNLLDFAPGALGVGSPEELLTSSTNAVTGGGSIQATGLGPAATDPGWYTPPVASGSLSQSIGRSGSTLVAVYTSQTTPALLDLLGPLSGWRSQRCRQLVSAAVAVARCPLLTQTHSLAGGPAGIVVVPEHRHSRATTSG